MIYRRTYVLYNQNSGNSSFIKCEIVLTINKFFTKWFCNQREKEWEREKKERDKKGEKEGEKEGGKEGERVKEGKRERYYYGCISF